MIIIVSLVALIAAIIIHEVAHAWTADRLGDPTARLMGRITLNPIPHLDLYGSFIVPLILVLIGSPVLLGWAKPVPFDPFNLKNPKRDSALIAIAGPISNFVLALILSVIFRLLASPFSPVGGFTWILYIFIQINIVLALFNLIPIHPLDGGKIFVGLLPQKEAVEADAFLRRYGIIILMVLILPIFGGTSLISGVLGPVLNGIMNLLVPLPL